jgi:outer membrane protein TolC
MGTHRMTSLRTLACAFLSAALAIMTVHAQGPAPAPTAVSGPITLEQALQLAEARSEAVAGAQAGIRRAEGEEIRARSGLYPQLSAALSYDRALASEFDGVFDNVDFGGAPSTGSGGETSTTSSSGSAGGGLEDLPFGRANTWRASLTFSQNIYSGGRLGAQRALALAGRTAARLTLTTTRAQLLFDVTQAYYDAALSERLVDIAEASLEQAGATLRQTQTGFDAGTQPEFEVLRARVSRDNQTPLLIRQRVNRDVALLRLKQLLDLPADADLRLTESLGDDALAPPSVFAQQIVGIESAMRSADWVSFTRQANAALPERVAVTEAATGVTLREASLRLAESQSRPSVALSSTYSRVAYPSNGLPTFDRTNWSVGASLSLPILTGGRQRGDEQVARAEVEQARHQRQQVEALAALDTRSAWAELLAAKATWEASSGTVQQASRAYQIANVRYGAGVSTQLELADSRLLLQQSDANRAQAARDLQVARARVALLPNLPLGAGGSPGGATGGAAPRLSQPRPPASSPLQDGQFRNASTQGSQTQGTR